MSIAFRKFPSVKKMNYDDVRGEIKSGDILLCSGSALFSKMIQKATESVWSHVAFIIRLDAIERVMVLESVEPLGVRTVPLSHYVHNYGGDNQGYPGRLLLARHDSFSDRSVTKLNKLSKFAVDLFGYPYDKDEIVRIAARIGKSLFGFSDRDVKRDKEYICSEYAWECYKSVGIEIPYDNRGFVSPKDFAAAKEVKAITEILVG